jgi:hypothetical protein
LAAALRSGRCIPALFFASSPKEKEGKQKDDDREAHPNEDGPTPARTINDHQRVGALKSRCFPVHSHFFRLAPRI